MSTFSLKKTLKKTNEVHDTKDQLEVKTKMYMYRITKYKYPNAPSEIDLVLEMLLLPSFKRFYRKKPSSQWIYQRNPLECTYDLVAYFKSLLHQLYVDMLIC